VVHLAATVDLGAVFRCEERDPLVAAFEKELRRPFVFYVQAEKADVEFLRAAYILDVENHVIDAGDFKRCFHKNLLRLIRRHFI
jgi:hypothetical protein